MQGHSLLFWGCTKIRASHVFWIFTLDLQNIASAIV